MEVGQDRHIFRAGVCQIGPVDHPHGPVNDRLFNGFQPVFAAHDQFTERQHKVGFQGQRVIVLGIVQVDVQWVHIVPAGGRQPDHLSVEPLHQRIVFGLRVGDKNIVRRR